MLIRVYPRSSAAKKYFMKTPLVIEPHQIPRLAVLRW
jgi:hypothetical protein